MSLILQVRAESLLANIGKLDSHFRTFPDPRKDFNQLEADLKSAKEAAKGAARGLLDVKLELENPTAKVADSLKSAESSVDKLRAALDSAITLVNALNAKCQRFEETELGSGLLRTLQQRTKPTILALRDVEDGIRQRGDDPHAQWDAFHKQADEVNTSLFAEYVDFLGGLALRDREFDAGISRVADELLRTYMANRPKDAMLAIPTRRQATAMKQARIIRIAFPDWTIWGLPATAHEFWRAFARETVAPDLRSTLRKATKNIADEVELKFGDCLGDAFATYTMGPAYALFAICLLLNPAHPYAPAVDGVADDVRVRSICHMLDMMDSKSQVIRPYAKIRERIENAWAEAIDQSGGRQNAVDDKLLSDEKKRVETLVEALFKTPGAAFSPFTEQMWGEAQGWVQHLLAEKWEQIQIPQGAELRHVLNAAWLARVAENRPADLDITVAANKLKEKVVSANGT
jgi:hypothetical protein